SICFSFVSFSKSGDTLSVVRTRPAGLPCASKSLLHLNQRILRSLRCTRTQISRLLDKSFTDSIFQVQSFAHRSHGLDHPKRRGGSYQTMIRIQCSKRVGVPAGARFHVDGAPIASVGTSANGFGR